MPIHVLSPDVTARIAAGEVVERPASVVKELVENALDAGAASITVEAQGGGVQLIRVTDDGCGIPAGEVALAFERHATSKLSSAGDLDAIRTLGFRGEALHAIAAVAWVTITTRTRDADVGVRLSVRWGERAGKGMVGCAPGTTVAVQDLFANTPARRGFLRTATAEGARIADTVSRMALAHPGVRFRLVLDGRKTMSTPGTSDPSVGPGAGLREAAGAVYGPDTGQALLEVGAELEGYILLGLVSPPSLSRSSRAAQSFFVNGRWVFHRALTVALEEAYLNLLQQGRYALAVLHLAVPPADLDVNVHPTKREVRFRQESRVFRLVQQAVRQALVEFSPVPQMSSSTVRPLGASTMPALLPPASPGVTFGMAMGQAPAVPLTPGPGAATMEGSIALPVREDGMPEGAVVTTPQQAMPLLRVIGQVELTYIVAEGPDGLYLIDQHAAHERVVFEQVKARAAARAPAVQPLLEPATVSLTPVQEAHLQESREFLEGCGFRLEPFGQRTWLVRTVPAVVRGAPAQALAEVLDLMAGESRVGQHEDLVAASVACHSAVRAGMPLGHQEMVELVRQLEAVQSPHTCPHGRPTMVHLSSRHLEREFGRR